MKLNSRDPLSHEAFEAVRARISEMSRDELMSYLDWRPNIAEDMTFPQHLPGSGIRERIAVNAGAEPKLHASSRTIRKSRHIAKV
jgi:hypothetical protein